MNNTVTTVREAIEWVEIRWHDEAQSKDLPRVLLVGDSIVVGHGTPLRDTLMGQLGVDYFATSKIVSDHEYMSDLEFMLAKYTYDVIIFNNGLHGGDVDDAIYAAALEDVLAALKKRTHHLVWRNNTPCFKRSEQKDSPIEMWVERSPKRNELAAQVVAKLGLPTLDAFSILRDKAGFSSDGVHFKPEGYALLVKAEAAYLANLINPGRSPSRIPRR